MRSVAAAVTRILVTTGVLLAIYGRAPVQMPDDGRAVGRLVVLTIVLVVVLTWQILSVTRSPYPGLRAVEAISVSFPLLILMFAWTYYVMDHAQSGSFNEPLDRVDAVYLTVTVLATVGFGDIVATSEATRAVVTFQMVVNMVLLGIVFKVLLTAVRQRRAALDADPGAADRTRDLAG
jgi:hypothetical protein